MTEKVKIVVTPKFTICTECAYFYNKEPGSPREDVWYNHLCQASPLPMGRDPYDGKMKPCNQNSFGEKYFTSEKYNYCRDTNPKGECNLFLKKEKKKKLRLRL